MNEDNECNNDSESIELERERNMGYKQTWIVKRHFRKKILYTKDKHFEVFQVIQKLNYSIKIILGCLVDYKLP